MVAENDQSIPTNKLQFINLMVCRKCKKQNPWVYFAPIEVFHNLTSVICYECAYKRNWLDQDGNLKEGIEL